MAKKGLTLSLEEIERRRSERVEYSVSVDCADPHIICVEKPGSTREYFLVGQSRMGATSTEGFWHYIGGGYWNKSNLRSDDPITELDFIPHLQGFGKRPDPVDVDQLTIEGITHYNLWLLPDWKVNIFYPQTE